MIVIDPPLAFFAVGLLITGWALVCWLGYINRQLEDEVATLNGKVLYLKGKAAQLVDQLSQRPSAEIIPIHAIMGGKHRRPGVVHIPHRGEINGNDRPKK